MLLLSLEGHSQSHPQRDSVQSNFKETLSMQGSRSPCLVQVPFMAQTGAGIVPDNDGLFPTSKLYRDGRSAPRVSGIVPEKELPPNQPSPRELSMPNWLGIGPEWPLLETANL